MIRGASATMKTILMRLIPPIVAERFGSRPATRSPAGSSGSTLGPLDDLVGMTSLSERRYYGRVVHDVSHLQGAIVDLGCWLGSTSLSLAMGLPETAAERVRAFDQFVWQPWMNQFLPMVACDYLEGDSFLPEARRRMSAAGNRIQVERVDLTSYQWESGPIKVLLVDAMKDAVLTRRIALSFYPALVPGAILLHQDFKHFNTSWLHLVQFRLRDYFELRDDVPGGGTVSFTTLATPTEPAMLRATSFDGIGDAEADEAFAHSLGLVQDGERAAVAAAHIMHYRHAGHRERARELLALYEKRYDPNQYDIRLAAQSVAAMAT